MDMVDVRSAVLLAAALSGSGSAAQAADADHPTVVELFQSQGCSSCPPANANLNALAGRSDILALSFAVTYWDQLGWKDTYAQPRFTQRQWAYSRAAKRSHVSTPQMIVNGRGALIGHRPAEVLRALRRFDRGMAGPALHQGKGKLQIGAGKTRTPGTLWLVTFDPRTHQVPIRAGENGGRTLPHRNIVRDLRSLGQWTGGARTVDLPTIANPALRRAVLLQLGAGGPIIAAKRIHP
jgi:hypothetical protein